MRRIIPAFLCMITACASGNDGGDERGVEVRALVDSLLPTLATLSGLEPRDSVRVAIQAPAEVRAFIERKLDEDLPPPELEGIRTAYGMLGLIPEEVDLRALLLELYSEQIVGYYDPEARTLYVVDGVARDALRPVLVHELVHALQDQHTNLDSLVAPERGNDRQLAAQAAIEGHATLVMFGFLAAEMQGAPVRPADLPDPADQLRPGLEAANAQFPVFREAPRAIREVLLFPYLRGASFVHALWQRAGGAAVAPFGSGLPQSTEQVLHAADRFLAGRDAPTFIAFEETVESEQVYENTLGEFETTLFLEQQLGAGAADAGGWDGDRYRVGRMPDGTLVLDWVLVFDDDNAADRFARNASRALEQLPRQSRLGSIRVEGRAAVRIRIAGTEAALRAPPPHAVIVEER